jgi:hypothetical protein
MHFCNFFKWQDLLVAYIEVKYRIYVVERMKKKRKCGKLSIQEVESWRRYYYRREQVPRGCPVKR